LSSRLHEPVSLVPGHPRRSRLWSVPTRVKFYQKILAAVVGVKEDCALARLAVHVTVHAVIMCHVPRGGVRVPLPLDKHLVQLSSSGFSACF
jgi:hypothetical protein